MLRRARGLALILLAALLLNPLGVAGGGEARAETTAQAAGLSVAASPLPAWTGINLDAVIGLDVNQYLNDLQQGATVGPNYDYLTNLSWFLIDESAGLALTSGERAGSTLLVSGVLLYLAWVGGTAVGVLAGSLAALRAAADAVFPVLFIGLAAMSANGRGPALRAAAAALLTLGLALAWPQGRGLAPVLAALAVSLPGGRGSS